MQAAGKSEGLDPAAVPKGDFMIDKVPYRYRWIHCMYAFLWRYFWLPCPLCHRNFGGHEWKETLYTSWDDGVGVCPMCADIARKRNEHLFNTTKPEPRYVVIP